jgi:glutaredoxin
MEVIVLSQDNCSYCDEVYGILSRLAAEYLLSLTTVDLAQPEGQVLAERAGMFFTPGIFIDGEAFSFGRTSEKKLRREIERRLAAKE